MADLLETTLTMLKLEKHLSEFKSYGIDSSILPLLSNEDLKIIGIEDDDLRNKVIKQVSNLKFINESTLDHATVIDKKYAMKVLIDMNHHLNLMNASLSYAYLNDKIQKTDVKLSKGTECLINSTNSLKNQARKFCDKLCNREKKSNKMKYALLAIISATASAYILKKVLANNY